QRLHVIAAWREAPFYSERERAALEWAEALTLIADGDISDALFESVRKQFSEQELAALTLTIVSINGWNRLSVAFRSPVGTYRPGMFER
ncbi:MAG TPA: carboxymuconolactone decarboxylase family protein, partial [Polyangiales bacterium]|nr:carboxymuconolactone decarboxylase family protein [Polyangiales bacterium]